MQKNNAFHKFYFYTNFFSYRSIYQIFENDVILLNHGSLFREKDSLQLKSLQFSKMNKLLRNSEICS